MPIDPTAFRPVGAIVFGSARTKKFPQQFDTQLVRVTAVLGPPPAGKKDNRKNWHRAGFVTQVDRTGAAIRRYPIDLSHPLLFQPDLDLIPYWLSFWRPTWVTPLTLRIEKYLLPLRPVEEDPDSVGHSADFAISLDFNDP
jgi:hypothetical protein